MGNNQHPKLDVRKFACPEIQDLKREEKHQDTGKWQEGDLWTTVFETDGVFVVHNCNDAWADEPHYLHHPIECIWLPTSDAIVEMIIYHCHCHYCLLTIADEYIVYKEKVGTWELRLPWNEFWLEVLMWWNWNKIWDGEKWILIK